ncbi:hypothetical protein [Bradyrhizobium cenepequi]|nr:hypothetical protein [Bradyrhizobium cenepequi]
MPSRLIRSSRAIAEVKTRYRLDAMAGQAHAIASIANEDRWREIR